MIVQILDEAEQDLIDGFHFYEAQAEGLGEYFVDALSADIESLRIYAGIHSKYFGQYRLLSRRFQFKGRDSFCGFQHRNARPPASVLPSCCPIAETTRRYPRQYAN